MPNALTIIIPVGPAHMHIWEQAAESVEQQTVKCDLIVQQDPHGKGAGWGRNRGIERATTPLIAFLDADDIISPTFAEICLGVLSQYAQTNDPTPRYVYTDWLGDGNKPIIAPLPCDAWVNGPMNFHLVTAVVPTDRARLIGGFDENMMGAEDADFYIRLRLSGVCGLHIHSPSNPLKSALVSYREGGQRSIQARASGQEERAKQYMSQRYGGYNLMGCCGDNTQHPITPTNEPQEGDILAQALWNGNRIERGRATGRLYPRTSFPKLMYVNPQDVDAAPHLWKRQTDPMQASNGVILQPAYKPDTGVPWQQTANAIFGGGTPQPVSQPIVYNMNVPGRKKSDTVKDIQEWVKVEGDLE